MHKTGLILAAAGLAGLSMTTQAQQGERFIILASTTSTENSGLFDAILPPFTAATDIECASWPWGPVKPSRSPGVAAPTACTTYRCGRLKCRPTHI
ncbi:hypothetical protein [Halomonas jincaotanensis]|uniref:hypothetical protein n=1 Tax=Halomonas jincaotanensis TaxID=2810616 RepID=UPI002022F3AA|nr:hypothetical protein [Halomonas jincaotanensis]